MQCSKHKNVDPVDSRRQSVCEGHAEPRGSGYILKDSVPEEMITGIRKVMQNEVYFSSAIKGVVVSMFSEVYTAEGVLKSRIKRRQMNRPSFGVPNCTVLLFPRTLCSALT